MQLLLQTFFLPKTLQRRRKHEVKAAVDLLNGLEEYKQERKIRKAQEDKQKQDIEAARSTYLNMNMDLNSTANDDMNTDKKESIEDSESVWFEESQFTLHEQEQDQNVKAISELEQKKLAQMRERELLLGQQRGLCTWKQNHIER